MHKMVATKRNLYDAGKFCCTLLLLTTLLPSASAQQTDQAALRALVPPPRETLLHAMALTVGMSYQPTLGYGFYWDGHRFPTETAHLQQKVQHAEGAQQGELYRQLGELYRAQQEPQEAQKAFEHAVTLLGQALERKATKSKPGVLRAEYALALQASGQLAKAEAQIQLAQKQTPRDWQVWSAAGQIQTAHSLAMQRDERTQKPNAPLSTAAQRGWNAARADFDTAVRLAPNLPQPYEQRAAFLTTLSFVTHPSTASSVAGLADYERAVKRRPQEPYALAWLAWMEYTEYGVHYFPNQSYDNFAVWKVLPSANRRRLLSLRRQVEGLTTSRDQLVRAQAYTGLAWLEYEFHDVLPAQAQQHLRQALQAQPDFPEADEYLMHTFAIEEEWDSLARFSAERAQRLLDVRHNLIAAYACYKENRIDAAKRQIRAAITLRPNDPAANLFLAFLLLRHPAPEEAEAAGPYLDAVEAPPSSAGSSDPGRQAALKECTLLRSFSLALTGKREEARQRFARILETDRENAEARQGLMLLSP